MPKPTGRRLTVIEALPQGRYIPEGGEDALARLRGAKILRLGGLAEEAHIPGGGFVIEYCQSGGRPERLVLGFTEWEVWIEDQSSIPA